MLLLLTSLLKFKVKAILPHDFFPLTNLISRIDLPAKNECSDAGVCLSQIKH